MDSLVPRKAAFLFIVIVYASSISASFAGMPRKFISQPAKRIIVSTKEMPRMFFHSGGEARLIERVLKVRTNDYGRYDPSPTFVKPPFKLIPN
ncbi:unnamed protein product [Spirodela intermedia]|uniref:Uncharacterized protein n=2 Tax=Spirodela intermedia TaxID=51605 RepID=A0A7I8KKC0_SPIIN|nr:unnamed protein product [Spirodela intermedia]CAA6661164.1 unnamed protein product [Spirodela intermedia]CAA7397538.1 unnamed protein product [Spirodela intermedia]